MGKLFRLHPDTPCCRGMHTTLEHFSRTSETYKHVVSEDQVVEQKSHFRARVNVLHMCTAMVLVENLSIDSTCLGAAGMHSTEHAAAGNASFCLCLALVVLYPAPPQHLN